MADTRLTVTNDSVVFSDGSTVYRLHRGRRDLLLTDSYGLSLLTLHPKRISLHKRWEAFGDGSKPIFTVCRSSMIGRSEFTAKVYRNPMAETFKIEGSFESRRFTVIDAGSQSEVAEILIDGGEVDGEDVFLLFVKADFDSAFAVAIVFVLQEIGGEAASP
ncbi:hypothetical protein V2J09_005419 [Rumex salicifolius]